MKSILINLTSKNDNEIILLNLVLFMFTCYNEIHRWICFNSKMCCKIRHDHEPTPTNEEGNSKQNEKYNIKMWIKTKTIGYLNTFLAIVLTSCVKLCVYPFYNSKDALQNW